MPRKGPCKRFGSSVREFILNQETPQDEGFVKQFIMSCPPRPPEWGPLMEQELRARLTENGFHVTRGSCVAEHPVLQLRMRGSAELTTQDVTRRIRTLVREVGHRITSRAFSAFLPP